MAFLENDILAGILILFKCIILLQQSVYEQFVFACLQAAYEQIEENNTDAAYRCFHRNRIRKHYDVLKLLLKGLRKAVAKRLPATKIIASCVIKNAFNLAIFLSEIAY